MIGLVVPLIPDVTKDLKGSWVDDWNSVSTASYSGYRRGFGRDKAKKKWLEPNEGGRYPFNILTEEIIGD